MSAPVSLPALKRYITTHSPEGKAVFSTTITEDNSFIEVPRGKVAHAFATQGFPPDLNADRDIQSYQTFLINPLGISIPNGTVLRFVDIPPNGLLPLHRSVSLDYGIVIEGQVQLILDSGESRMLSRGDTAIQRGTVHAWKNNSESEWARMVFVVMECQPIEVGGVVLTEDFGDLQKE